MEKLFVGLDVSTELTTICIVDEAGAIVFEGMADTSPQAIIEVLDPYRDSLVSVGQESGSLAQWLHAGLVAERFPMVCIDATHAHAVLAVQRHKTDRNDALGIARLMMAGWVRQAHIRTMGAQQLRTALVFRRTLSMKINDLEHCIRQSLKCFGIRLGRVAHEQFSARVDAAVAGSEELSRITRSILSARDALLREWAELDSNLRRQADSDIVCARLMTVPGVGPMTALTFKATVDDPARFPNARAVGVYFGLTPRRRQSGQMDSLGGISKRGDSAMRALLFISASRLLRSKGDSRLKMWGLALCGRLKKKVAVIAVARKLSGVLYRIWVTEGQFHAIPEIN